MNNQEIEKVLKLGGFCRAQSTICVLFSAFMMLPFFLLVSGAEPNETLSNLISDEILEFALFVFGAFGNAIGMFGLDRTGFLAREKSEDSSFKSVYSPFLELLYTVKKMPEWVLFSRFVVASEEDELRIKSKVKGRSGAFSHFAINLMSVGCAIALLYWLNITNGDLLLNEHFIGVTWAVLVGVFALPLLVLSILVLIISNEIVEIVEGKNG